MPVKPPGNEAVLIDRPAPIVMESVDVETLRWLGALESVTVIEGVLAPEAVGVPEIAPEESHAEAGRQSGSRPGVRRGASASRHGRRVDFPDDSAG